jgi:hypothetical protein
MALDIPVEQVALVLLADEWHVVAAGSFEVGQAEITRDGHGIHGAGWVGFSFREGERWVRGPLTSILAVRVNE